MSSFSWLHLTDLHQGMKKHWLWPGVREMFFDDLKRLHDKCGPWDLVLFTGDLVLQGKDEEFQKVNIILDELWDFLRSLGSSPKLLAVPGNHDMARPSIEEPSVILLRDWDNHEEVQTKFWEEEASPYRQVISKAFENYSAWWKGSSFKPDNIKTGLLPGDFSVSIEKEGAKLGIVGLNTAFLQLTGDNYKNKLALHTRQFHEACDDDGPNWAKQHHACLLLTHHSPTWLNHGSKRHINQEITSHGRFAAHLCGHMHEADYREITEGGTGTRRIWQGCSLFGLEYFGQKNKRLHGYTAGKIELRAKEGNLLFWPREVRLQGEQRGIAPDHSLSLTDAQHTAPSSFALLREYRHTAKWQGLSDNIDALSEKLRADVENGWLVSEIRQTALERRKVQDEITRSERTVKVFISYSHDSEKHREKVRELMERLQRRGIECDVDLLHEIPPQGWSKWMYKRIEQIKFVLVVCSEAYYQYIGDNKLDKNGGVDWKGPVITEAIYAKYCRNTPCIPILFSLNDKDYIPPFLHNMSRYDVSAEEGYDHLYRRITSKRMELVKSSYAPKITDSPVPNADSGRDRRSRQREKIKLNCQQLNGYLEKWDKLNDEQRVYQEEIYGLETQISETSDHERKRVLEACRNQAVMERRYVESSQKSLDFWIEEVKKQITPEEACVCCN